MLYRENLEGINHSRAWMNDHAGTGIRADALIQKLRDACGRNTGAEFINRKLTQAETMMLTPTMRGGEYLLIGEVANKVGDYMEVTAYLYPNAVVEGEEDDDPVPAIYAMAEWQILGDLVKVETKDTCSIHFWDLLYCAFISKGSFDVEAKRDDLAASFNKQ